MSTTELGAETPAPEHEDPWAAMRAVRTSELTEQAGEHHDAKPLSESIPLSKYWRNWILHTVPDWFALQVPDADIVPHSDAYLWFNLPVPAENAKGRKVKIKRQPTPVVIFGRRVSRVTGIFLGALVLVTMTMVVR